MQCWGEGKRGSKGLAVKHTSELLMVKSPVIAALLLCALTVPLHKPFPPVDSETMLSWIPFYLNVCSQTPCSLIFLNCYIVHSLSHVWLFATPWAAAHQASLSFTISLNLLKLMSIELVMPSNHLILCLPLILLFSVFPNIRILSNELALHIRWPKYWSFNFSISPSNKYSELISFRLNWFDLLPVQGTLKSLYQHHNSKASVLQSSAFFMAQLTSIHDYWKNHSFDYTDLVGEVISLLLNMLSRFVIAFLPRSKHL